MTIHVDDPLTISLKFPNWCHLWSSSSDIDELDRFAARLGLKREWLQITRGMSGPFPHYDISPAKRDLELQLGAEYKPLRQYIAERLKERVKP